MRIQTLKPKMCLPVSLQEAFAVFGNPGNLAKIIPKVRHRHTFRALPEGGGWRPDKHG